MPKRVDPLADRRLELERRLAQLSTADRAAFDRVVVAEASGARSNAPVALTVTPRVPGTPVPLSFAQELLWMLERTNPGHAYNVPRVVRISGHLDRPALHRALDALVARHEALRTTFSMEPDGLRQIVHAPMAVPVTEVDLQLVPARDRDAEARTRVRELSRQPFDLECDLQLRATVIALDVDDHVVMLVSHHIASDGWSGNIVLRELGALYDGFRVGRPAELPALPVQYPDFAVWQRRTLTGDQLDTLLTYWRRTLDGAPGVLDLPTDRPRATALSFEGATRSTLLPQSVMDGVNALSREEGATTFMVLLAALYVLLYRYTSEDELVVGSPVAGRTLPELDGVVGLFTNVLLLRASVAGNPTFRDLVGQVRSICLGAYDHQEIPLEALLLDRGPEAPVVATVPQVVFVMGDKDREVFHLPGTRNVPFGAARNATKFDLTVGAAEQASGLRVSAEFRIDLFDDATIDRLLHHYGALLEAIIAAPETRVAALPLFTSEERSQLLGRCDGDEAEYPRHATIHGLIAEQVRRRPQAPAVEYVEGGRHLRITYQELDRRANQMAWALVRAGVRLEDKVAVCTARSVEAVVAILGVLKAGGAYVPLDPSYPDERLQYIIGDAGAKLLLTDSANQSRLRLLSPQTQILEVSHPGEGTATDDAPPIEVAPRHLAYVIYTSGSTGRPKGVMVEHRNVTRLLINDRFPFTFDENDVWTVFHSFAFDFSVWELFGALIRGACAVLVPRAVAQSPDDLLSLLERTGTTVLNQVPSAFNGLMRVALARRPNLRLRYVIFGGEALKPALLAEWQAAWPRVRLINMFGITETTVLSTYKEIGAAEIAAGVENVGRPMPTVTVYLLDSRLQPVPTGVTGEICVGGLGVARGYLNRPELTADRFIADPFGRGERIYRSGDLGRRLPNGDLEYIGRRDDQIKLRGHRIELGEIEASLLQIPGVAAAVAIVREDTAGDQRLAAYVVPAANAQLSPTVLLSRLKEMLPAVMVPTAITCLDRLPVTSSGKLDRKALPAPTSDVRSAVNPYVAPRKPMEMEVAAIWSAVLVVEHVGVDDDFFELGGNSLLAMRMIAELERVWGRRLPFRSFLERPTVAEVVRVLVSAAREEEKRGLPVLQADGPGTPFVFAHGDISGYGWYCRRLAPLLGKSPLIVLPTLGGSGPSAPLTIEAMASAHVDAVQEIQPGGPYRLGGFCHGGIVAFEMARQLTARGETVEALIIVDGFCSNLRFRVLEPLIGLFAWRRNKETRVERRARILYGLHYYPWRLRQVWRMPLVDQVRWSLRMLRRLGGRQAPNPPVLGSPLPSPDAESLYPPGVVAEPLSVLGVITRAQQAYMPGRYAGRVDLICATEVIARRRGTPGQRWERVADEVRPYAIEGDHLALVMPERIPALAEQIKACLEKKSGA